MNDNELNLPSGAITVYQAEGGATRIRVLLDNDTVWLTQRQLSALYDVGVNTINYHIKSIYKDRELTPTATIRKYRIVQSEGSREVERLVDHYNLDLIIAIGYRVRSDRGTAFRQWATERLREYLVKGFTLDDERLKGGSVLKRDVGTAKHYLDATEIDTLNRITVMFLDQAEFRSQRRQDICMRDWDQLLDKFLLDTELHVLPDTGSVSHENAMQWAEEQYDAFAQRRRLTAEDAAEQRYFDDLRTAAQALETTRSSPTQKKKSTSSRTKGRKRK